MCWSSKALLTWTIAFQVLIHLVETLNQRQGSPTYTFPIFIINMAILQSPLDLHLIFDRKILVAVEIVKVALDDTIQTRDLGRCYASPAMPSKSHRCRIIQNVAYQCFQCQLCLSSKGTWVPKRNSFFSILMSAFLHSALRHPARLLLAYSDQT